MSSGLVCLMGMGIVFIGLICIVIICKIMSFLVTRFTKGEDSAAEIKPAAATAAPVATPAMPVEEKRAMLAGICAVIAEELGTDASNIRVRSFRRV